MKSQYGCKNHVVFILGTVYVCHVIFFKRQISVIIFLLEMQQNGSSNSKIQEKLDPSSKYNFTGNRLLASCPWGPATAPGVGILTELYVK